MFSGGGGGKELKMIYVANIIIIVLLGTSFVMQTQKRKSNVIHSATKKNCRHEVLSASSKGEMIVSHIYYSSGQSLKQK